jgi:hypothetical protein
MRALALEALELLQLPQLADEDIVPEIDRVVTLRGGRVLHDGPTQEVLRGAPCASCSGSTSGCRRSAGCACCCRAFDIPVPPDGSSLP